MSEKRYFQPTTGFYWISGLFLLFLGIALGIITIRTLSPDNLSTNRPDVVERVELGSRISSSSTAASPVVVVDPRQLSSMFKGAATSIRQSVVFIQVTVGPTDESWYQNLENRFFEDQFDRQSVGSGVIISSDGYVVTNHHVVAGAKEIKVTLEDKREYIATTVGSDPATDLAVLKIEEPSPLVAAPLGDSDVLEVGEWVLAVGNPFRLTSTVTAGIISALGRQVNIIDSRFGIEDFIQTDAAINPGNSGGALVNLRGELIGINTAIATETGSNEGYGFAVPVRLVERIVTDLIKFGEVKRGYLGVEIQAVDASVAERVGMSRIEGVFLNSVQKGGAASDAGLRRGDVILSIGDRAVNAPNELQSTIARKRPGDAVEIYVWRRSQRIPISVTLAGADDPVTSSWLSEMSPQPGADSELDNLIPRPQIEDVSEYGIGLSDITEEIKVKFDVTQGAYVSFVQKGSAADFSGLHHDRVILSLNGNEVTSAEEAVGLLQALDQESAVLIESVRPGGLREYFEILP